MSDQPTIFALSSGRGRAGVAVIRISGPSARLALDRMASPCPPSRRAAFRRIVHPETRELLDAALVLFFAGPSSETGEDIAELQVHGSPAVVTGVLKALSTLPGCRLAEPGEFARRSFLNGKIDLTAAEGLADLIDAETDAQRRQALAQAGGALARLYNGWRQTILEARAFAEAAIDFSDEPDVAADAIARAQQIAAPLLADVQRHLAGTHRGEIVRDGFKVVLAGPPNAGKSSLLNALARREVAIVSSEPGTTRDVLEVHLDLGGYAVIVADTAGLRDSGGPIEIEGMRRARERASRSDLVVWIADVTQPEPPPPDLSPGPDGWLMVLNKIDLLEPSKIQGRETIDDLAPMLLPSGAARPVRISARTGDGIPDLLDRITSALSTHVQSDTASIAPTQERHRMALSICTEALTRSIAADNSAAELVAEDLRLAADALGRLTGRIDAEEILGSIFGRFCIGK